MIKWAKWAVFSNINSVFTLYFEFSGFDVDMYTDPAAGLLLQAGTINQHFELHFQIKAYKLKSYLQSYMEM